MQQWTSAHLNGVVNSARNVSGDVYRKRRFNAYCLPHSDFSKLRLLARMAARRTSPLLPRPMTSKLAASKSLILQFWNCSINVAVRLRKSKRGTQLHKSVPEPRAWRRGVARRHAGSKTTHQARLVGHAAHHKETRKQARKHARTHLSLIHI